MVTTLLVAFAGFLFLVLWLWALKLAQLRAEGRLELIEASATRPEAANPEGVPT